MPRESYTAHFHEQTGNTSGEAPLYLLEITHDQLAVPARYVNDNQDIVSNGDTFYACAFRITLPDDVDKQLPRARLTIDNVGRELTQWLDASAGGRGASVRAIQIQRDDPDVLEYDITLDLLSVSQNLMAITAELGFEDTLNLAGLPITYRPENTPGIF